MCFFIAPILLHRGFIIPVFPYGHYIKKKLILPSRYSGRMAPISDVAPLTYIYVRSVLEQEYQLRI